MVKMLNFAQGKGRIGIGVTISKYKSNSPITSDFSFQKEKIPLRALQVPLHGSRQQSARTL